MTKNKQAKPTGLSVNKKQHSAGIKRTFNYYFIIVMIGLCLSFIVLLAEVFGLLPQTELWKNFPLCAFLIPLLVVFFDTAMICIPGYDNIKEQAFTRLIRQRRQLKTFQTLCWISLIGSSIQTVAIFSIGGLNNSTVLYFGSSMMIGWVLTNFTQFIRFHR